MNGESIIPIRVDRGLHTQMKIPNEINWSVILRKAIAEEIEQLERIDRVRAKRATKMIDAIGKSQVFDSGKSSDKIIREWRNKRK